MKTIRFARILLVLLAVFVGAVVLPYYYWMAFDTKTPVPFVAYSPVTDSFLFTRTDSGSARFMDEAGRSLTREQYEELLPLLNYRQLAATGKMPDSLRGVALDLRTVGHNNLFFRLDPGTFEAPQIPIYPLIESQSGRVQLEFPGEFFRIADRMEFVRAADNTVDEEQSTLFTAALTAQGFRFPARTIAGNPTTMKPFDEGYFVVDDAGAVFHIKKVKGQPFCVNTGIPADLGIRHLFISEMPLREFYGVIVTIDHRVLLISYDGYRLLQLPLDRYNGRTTMLQFRGDLFFRTLVLVFPDGVEAVVTDRAYKVVDRYTEQWTPKREVTAGLVARALFPFTIELAQRYEPYVNLYWTFSGALALVGIFASLGILIAWMRFRSIRPSDAWIDLVVVALSGVFGLLAVLLIRDPD